MDQHLEDSLSFEESMGVPFDNSVDISEHDESVVIEPSPSDGISMEFETIEEQPVFMETTGEEETIVPDYFTEEYTLEPSIDYVDNSNVLESTSLDDTGGGILTGTDNNMAQLQYQAPQIITIKPQPVKPAPLPPVTTPPRVSTLPRPVAIAPKPSSSGPAPVKLGKPLSIAPKPTFIGGKAVKTITLGNIMQGQKGSVLAQIGKQLVLVSPGGAGDKKPRFVQATSQQIQTQLIQTKGSTTVKPLIGKVILQAGAVPSSSDLDQPAVLSKISSGVPQGARFIASTQQNVIFGSPTKLGARFSKAVPAQTQPQKLVITKPGVGQPARKVVITANPQQNIVWKNAMPAKVVSQPLSGAAAGSGGGRMEIHKINVPGKGVQYIKLMTNPNALPKPVSIKPAPAQTTKTILLTDSKGNVISSQAQPLVVTTGPSGGKVMSKPQQKFVRIAPIGSKAVTINPPMVGRGQSLLAPRAATTPAPVTAPDPAPVPPPAPAPPSPPHDNKEALRMLIENAVRESPQKQHQYDTPEVETETIISGEAEMPAPATAATHRRQSSAAHDKLTYSFNVDENSNQHLELSFSPEPITDNEIDNLRPRKACNCTKSQCLKLYCDCFANGEFCYRCNCMNCHNNLENEELRQKAIRGCLDRNPNAFRPKIGKANAVGPVPVRRHNKGCNCKRSGCLKNYCECYEAKIACSAMCKCVGCRNVEDALRRRDARRPPAHAATDKQPCTFLTSEVIEAVCQCLIAAGSEPRPGSPDPAASPAPPPAAAAAATTAVLEEFARCLQDVIAAAHRPPQAHA